MQVDENENKITEGQRTGHAFQITERLLSLPSGNFEGKDNHATRPNYSIAILVPVPLVYVEPDACSALMQALKAAVKLQELNGGRSLTFSNLCAFNEKLMDSVFDYPQ